MKGGQCVAQIITFNLECVCVGKKKTGGKNGGVSSAELVKLNVSEACVIGSWDTQLRNSCARKYLFIMDYKVQPLQKISTLKVLVDSPLHGFLKKKHPPHVWF